MYHAHIVRWSPRIAAVIGSNRPRRICFDIAAWVQRALRAAELKTDEAMLTDDGNFHDIDAAFADSLAQVTALATELNYLTGTGLPVLKEPS